MWKKNLLAICLLHYAVAAMAQPHSATPKKWTETEMQAEIQQRLQTQQSAFVAQQTEIEQKRSLFLTAEKLLKSANEKNWAATELLLKRIVAQLKNYPLVDVLNSHIFVSKIKFNTASAEEKAQFIAQNSQSKQAQALLQQPFDRLFEAQKLPELVAYAQKISPVGEKNQCRVFAAEFQLLAEQNQPNPEAEQAGGETVGLSPDMVVLLKKFGDFWEKATFIPSECNGVEAFWRDQKLKLEERIKARALYLSAQNNSVALAQLAQMEKEPLRSWLNMSVQLLAEPKNLQNFAETQPLDAFNKSVVVQHFSRFLSTFPEDTPKPDFSLYQKWAEKFQLNESELSDWKSSFIRRFFDNPDPAFQAWRDEQIVLLKNDTLTERRLRMAIAQQSELKSWLALLSDEGKAKLEWRYWQAKISEPKEREMLWSALAKERGFYPMLAAQQLGKVYQFTPPQVDLTLLNGLEKELAKFREFLAMDWKITARDEWKKWVKTLPFAQQVAVAQYANEQGWFDLGVEATIQAKAWDYIPQRLPLAYADWFALHLSDKPIQQSFAMAIARQESAWNPSVSSHANAMGLMQLLPSTAKATAEQMGLPYTAEADLFDPFLNIMLGTAHLTELHAKYPNNRILIAAAYNAGASRVQKWLEKGGGKLAMDEFIASIPYVETRNYVQNVLAYDFYYQTLLGIMPTMFTSEELRKY